MPKPHWMYSGKNAKVLGIFKDEIGGKVLKEFIGLRPKCYSLLFWEEEKRKIGEKQVAKGPWCTQWPWR